MAEQSRVLDGIRILELGHWLVCPVAAMILGDWGADVIKVENPKGGDAFRGMMQSGLIPISGFNYLWELANRNKRSICIDITSDDGKHLISNLVEHSDVFISNFRPVVLERLGYDYKSLSDINPRIIYCQITGYGTEGPGRDWAGMDETAFWAKSGIMSLLGEPDTPPPPLHGAMGDMPIAMFAAGSIALTLYHREKTGVGQKIDLSLFHSGMWVAGCDIQASIYTGLDIERQSRKKKTNPLYNSYQTKDRKWLFLGLIQSDRYWHELCKALSIEDFENDPRFNSHENRAQNNELLISLLDEAVAKKTMEELAECFYALNFVWAPAQTTAEAVNDPNTIENQYIIEYEHPSAGLIRSLASPAKFSKTPSKVKRHAPELGEHTEEILLDFGYDWDDITRLKDKGVIM